MFNALKKKLFGGEQGQPRTTGQATPPMPQEVATAEAAGLVTQGNALLDQGKHVQAAERYRRATQLNPGDASAFINLGFALTEQGLHAEAEAPLKQAVQLNPHAPDALFLLGTSCKERGDVGAAIENYAKTLEIKPDFELCRQNLCQLLVENGNAEEAKEVVRAGIAITPEVANFHFYLGNLLMRDGDVDGAIASFRNALSIQPTNPEGLVNLGTALHAKGEFNAAVESFGKAISFNPEGAEVHFKRGLSLQELGNTDAAVESYRRAISLEPNRAIAHHFLGNALHDQGKSEAAIKSYLQALALEPAFAEAHNNLGSVYQRLGKLDQAVESYRRALAIQWNYPEAHCNLGTALHAQSKLDGAIASYRAALSIAPDHIPARIYMGGVLQEQGDLDAAIENYQRVLSQSPDHLDAHSNLLFTMNYHPDKSAEEIFAAYREYDQSAFIPLRSAWSDHDNSRDATRRLRVGYVSPDFRRHAIQHFLEPLISHHDKLAVEVFAYAELAQEDALTAHYRGHADHWIATQGMSDEALAQRIRLDRIDVLVDLAGHTWKNRLGVFARKPAPVSVTWLGYGYSTGLSAIDYMFTDEVGAPPGSEHLFSEQPWRLATPGYAFRPSDGMVPVSSLPAAQRGFVTFGTLTRAIRINHRSVRVWAEILKQVPGSHLVANSRSYQDAGVRARLTEQFAAHRIEPGRLDFGFHSPPGDVLRGIDIGLDCFPHNSGTTLFETLYMGVPFVTLADRPSVGRLGSSILHGVGHPEWIAKTEDEYIQIATALAGDLPALSLLRGRLRAEMESSPLRDEAAFSRKAEEAYRRMFSIWAERSGTAP